MAKKIYIGNMIQDLQSSIADLQTDIGTMSTDMASVVAELINVKEAVATGVNSVVVKAGIDNVVILNDTEISKTNAGLQLAKAFVCKCAGVIQLDGELKSSVAPGPVQLHYKINGGAAVYIASNNQTAYVAFSYNLPVADNDLVELYLDPQAAGRTAYLNAGTTISYSLVDVVNDGAIIIK